MASVAVNFALGVLGGLAANIGMMKLNAAHKGCANVCTLCQFCFGLSQSLTNPAKRAVLFGRGRQLPLYIHAVFASMFFAGPFLGNLSVSFTNQDFYPIFLVVRSCGSVSSMLLGYLFAGKKYSAQQIAGVLFITVGAGVTTLGCYNGSQAAKAAASGGDVAEPTPPHLFFAGLGLLLLNLLNDSGLGVLQAKVFAPYLAAAAKAKAAGEPAKGSVVDESMVLMSAAGTVLMAMVAGREVLVFLSLWAAEPTWWRAPVPFTAAATLPFRVPFELLLLSVNFYGNWNAKLICTWLNAHASAVLSALVPMLYRLISTVISANAAKGVVLPVYTWVGVGLVFGGSLLFLLAGKSASPPVRGGKKDA